MNFFVNLFKKYLVPHEGNDHNPHLFREASIATLFTLILALFVVAVGSRIIIFNSDLPALVLPNVLVDYANSDRSAQEYSQLTVSPILQKAAQMKADDMATKGYFAHTSPDGHSPWYWFEQAGYDFSYAGENLAVNFDDSVDVNTAWMNSPGHRANILNSNFTEIGIATAEGMYQGKKTVFVVQLFGRPAVKTAVVPPTVTPKTENKSVSAKTPATPPKVLSASVSSGDANPNVFVSTQKESAPIPDSSAASYSSWFSRVALSPGKSLFLSYVAIAVLLLLGLFGIFFSKVKKHNSRSVLAVFGLLILIFGLLYIYKSLLFTGVVVA